MSIIPKINVGVSKRKERHNWNFDSSTTANIGQVQPTMCRELVPGESIQVNTRSFVRLSPVAVPTFGRMSLRNYHCFVPYNECYDRFDTFITAQSCKHVNGTNYVPGMHYFNTFAQIIFSYSDVTLYKRNTRHNQPERPVADIYDMITSTTSDVAELGNAFLGLKNGIGISDAWHFNDTGMFYTSVGLSPNNMGHLVNDTHYVNVTDDDAGISISNTQGYGWAHKNVADSSDPNNIQYVVEPVRFTAFDYAFEFQYAHDNVVEFGIALFRLKPIAKRFRSLVLGLGYAFTPFEDPNNKFNVLKLIAFYKCYFSLFAPTREQNFEMTKTYALMQHLHDSSSYDISNLSVFSDFIIELMNVAYYLPMDYFSMAISTPDASNSSTAIELDTPTGGSVISRMVQLASPNSAYGSVLAEDLSNGSIVSNNYFNPIFFKVAQQFLTFANKNTVIGRSVRDWLKTHFGYVDSDVRKVNGVEFLGSNRVEVQIGEVMSNAQVPDGSVLGEYAGRGTGFNSGETISCSTDKFGCYLVLTVIVPESGYNQGFLRENCQIDRFDFPTEDFDALGYQALMAGELMDAYNTDLSGNLDGSYYQSTHTFGFVPRYSHHKVGRNIVNGDLSLPSLENQYGSYTFDRQFPTRLDPFKPRSIVYNAYMPTVVFDGFRKLDMTDSFGNYNRIFNYVGVDMDHFIIHQVFDVNLMSPLKSLSNSFDAVSEGDDTTVDVTHS